MSGTACRHSNKRSSSVPAPYDGPFCAGSVDLRTHTAHTEQTSRCPALPAHPIPPVHGLENEAIDSYKRVIECPCGVSAWEGARALIGCAIAQARLGQIDEAMESGKKAKSRISRRNEEPD